MSIKSSMQMLNLGLNIFSKLQTMQHRQIKMANSLALEQKAHRKKRNNNNDQLATMHHQDQVTIIQNEEI